MITWCRRENGVTSLKFDILPGYWLAFDTQIWIHRISLHLHEVIDYLSLLKGQLIRPVNVISHIAVHTTIYYETWIIRLVLPSWPVNLRWYSFLLRSVWNLLSVGLTQEMYGPRTEMQSLRAAIIKMVLVSRKHFSLKIRPLPSLVLFSSLAVDFDHI